MGKAHENHRSRRILSRSRSAFVSVTLHHRARHLVPAYLKDRPNEALGIRAMRLLLVPTAAGFDYRASGGSKLGPFTSNGRILLPHNAHRSEIRPERFEQRRAWLAPSREVVGGLMMLSQVD